MVGMRQLQSVNQIVPSEINQGEAQFGSSDEFRRLVLQFLNGA
jgi:hypothetical protein